MAGALVREETRGMIGRSAQPPRPRDRGAKHLEPLRAVQCMGVTRGRIPDSRRGDGRREPRAAAQSVDRGAVRRRAMLRAASELFLERGFEATRVADVVRVSGGSLANLYAWFGSKRGLFEAIIDELASQIGEAVDSIEIPSAPLEEALQRLGVQYLDLALSPRALAWYRLAVGDGSSFPELRAAVLERGTDRFLGRIAIFLTSRLGGSSFDAAESYVAAQHLCALLKSEVHLAAACGEPVDRSPARIAARTRRAVAAFLHGHFDRETMRRTDSRRRVHARRNVS